MRSDTEWREWGRVDPLWAVSAFPGRRKGEARAWTADELLALGQSDWAAYLRQWRQYGLTATSCVEIGCGVGRMTAGLADTFETVHALDVSPEMIEHARSLVGSDRVEYHLTAGASIPLPESCVTAAFSTFVFQHFNDIGEARRYLAEIARVLQPGGTMMIQLPMHSWPAMRAGFEALYRMRKAVGSARADVRRVAATRLGWTPPMRKLSYEVRDLLAALVGLGFEDVEVRIFQIQSAANPQEVVLARLAQPAAADQGESETRT